MKVLVIGTGYVGLVQGVCLAELGHEVVCIDTDQAKIKALRQGKSPIYEPGLDTLLQKNIAANQIVFDTDLTSHINTCEISFIAVGTPSDDKGRADLTYVFAVADAIGHALKNEHIIVTKSTVPVGTNKLIAQRIAKNFDGSSHVVSNPEFLREESALNDFTHPDRIIIGADNAEASQKVAGLYSNLDAPVLHTTLETAEMIKYASNSYLAAQISFINAMAMLCEKVGADVVQVSQGMKMDGRIGKRAFLNAGLGYGGSCFPKDIRALISIAHQYDSPIGVLEAVEQQNLLQRKHFVQKATSIMGSLAQKRIAVWGIAFKPGTDDIREAPAIDIMRDLMLGGAKVVAYDPIAARHAKKILPEVIYSDNLEETCAEADALLIITEWDEIIAADLTKVVRIMKNPHVIDGRNAFDPKAMRQLGFHYASVGRL